jgi:type IV pilus assembly protein PilN
LKAISLLPPELKAERQRQRRRAVLLVGSAVVLLVFIGTYAALLLATFRTEAAARALQLRRVAVEKEMEQYREYVALQARLDRAASLLQQAVGRTPDWAQLLVDVNRDLPPVVWLTDLSASFKPGQQAPKPLPPGEEPPAGGATPALQTEATGAPGGAGELTLRGLAADHAAVAGWLEAIRRVPGLADVRCQFSTGETVEGRQVVRFEIKAAVQPGPPYRVLFGGEGEAG